MHPTLRRLAHRPYPPPGDRPWIMAQTWYDLCFMHWRVAPKDLRPLIPAALEIDLWRSDAYVAVVPFGMKGVRLRGTPNLPWLSRFLELNVRTYVKHRGRPGVFFFSLDAANPVAVRVARAAYHLPYYDARMKKSPAPNEGFHYESERTHRGAPAAILRVAYRPTAPVAHAAPGSLEAFLTERYRLLTVDRRGRPYSGEIHHEPWPLQLAEADIDTNTMTAPHGLRLEGAPLVHFAASIDTIEWAIRPE